MNTRLFRLFLFFVGAIMTGWVFRPLGIICVVAVGILNVALIPFGMSGLWTLLIPPLVLAILMEFYIHPKLIAEGRLQSY